MGIKADFIDWQSELGLAQVFEQAESLAYPVVWRDGALYLTTIADQQNRATLVYRSFTAPSKAEILIPEPFDLRTRICEYGGKPFWLNGDELIFVNDADQCLYRLELGARNSTPQQITPADKGYRFADVVVIAKNTYLAVCEQYGSEHADPKASIAYIFADANYSELHHLDFTADFFSNLVVDTQRQKLAWVQWQHPNMPWDETELWVADFIAPGDFSDNSDGFRFEIISPKRVALPASASVCQLLFANSGELFYAADFSNQPLDSADNYWNIWKLNPSDLSEAPIRVTHERVEFAYPHWQYGDARLVQLDQSTLLAVASQAEQDVLHKIDLASFHSEPIDCAATGFQNLYADGQSRAIMLGKYSTENSALLMVNNQLPAPTTVYATAAPLECAEVSIARHIQYQAPGAESPAYGFYYPPCNTLYAAEQGELPPLIVTVHGGPTARAYAFFDLQKQFWTQRGFAILDVNHRGSCGYGRAFRDSLYGQWGVADTDDIAAAVQAVIEGGLADPDRVCIRGKSAGGYAVLRCLTQHAELFKVGACYYGIGNLVTLAATTHKFEKYYTDRLVGETFELERASLPSSKFYQRSPINGFERLESAMIVFQGGQDKVVPPSVAHEVISALKVQNLPHKYVEYAAEGHGFRQPENNIDAWQQELGFYRQHL